MRGATHLAFAGLVGVVGSGLGMAPGTVAGAALAVGALLPDIDTTTSGIGRYCKPLSGLSHPPSSIHHVHRQLVTFEHDDQAREVNTNVRVPGAKSVAVAVGR